MGKACALGPDEAKEVMRGVHSVALLIWSEIPDKTIFQRGNSRPLRTALRNLIVIRPKRWNAALFEKAVILCVVDTPSALEGRKMLLEENGHRVLTAANGNEAVHTFVANSVDLVLLDYHMPGMDGGTTASLMRPVKSDVPNALLSGDDCLPVGVLRNAARFIGKSEPIASFLEKVHHLLYPRMTSVSAASASKEGAELARHGR